jgi:hypothetical protein
VLIQRQCATTPIGSTPGQETIRPWRKPPSTTEVQAQEEEEEEEKEDRCWLKVGAE